MFSTHPEVCAYLREAFEQVSETEFKALLPQLWKDLHEEPGYKIPVPFLLLHGANDKSGIYASWLLRGHMPNRKANTV
jgi:hypothetical protein